MRNKGRNARQGPVAYPAELDAVEPSSDSRPPAKVNESTESTGGDADVDQAIAPDYAQFG